VRYALAAPFKANPAGAPGAEPPKAVPAPSAGPG